MSERRTQVLVLTFVGVILANGLWRTRDVQAMQRNRYLSLDDCDCDYGSAQCHVDQGQWYGPWYLRDAALRAGDAQDPGPGHCNVAAGVEATAGSGAGVGGQAGGYGYGHGSGYRFRGPVAVEEGYRRGFGGTARLGFAGG